MKTIAIYSKFVFPEPFKLVEEVKSPYSFPGNPPPGTRPKPGIEATCCCFSKFGYKLAFKCGYCFVKIISLPENFDVDQRKKLE